MSSLVGPESRVIEGSYRVVGETAEAALVGSGLSRAGAGNIFRTLLTLGGRVHPVLGAVVIGGTFLLGRHFYNKSKERGT